MKTFKFISEYEIEAKTEEEAREKFSYITDFSGNAACEEIQ